MTPPTAPRPLRDALHRRLLAAPFDPAQLESGELRARLEDLLRDEAPLVTDTAAASVVDDGPPRYVSRLDRHPAWVAEAVKSQAES